MFDLIPAYFYWTFYLILMGLLVVFQVVKLMSVSNEELLDKRQDTFGLMMALALTIFLILFFGTRNPYTPVFRDTLGYAGRYEGVLYNLDGGLWRDILTKSDPLFGYICIWFADAGFNVSVWLTFVAACYVLFLFGGVYKLFPEHPYLASLFAYLNFGFYSGGVNGIRNAMALSIVFFTMSLILKKRSNVWLIAALFVCSYYIHSSVVLPVVCLLLAKYVIKKPEMGIVLWIVSIGISLLAGSATYSFFEGFGFDQKLDAYLDVDTENQSSQWGFRWDFLLFSALPIVWGWWVICRRGISDRTYDIIFNTYTLANSLWVIVIRASFSNRFAALSWFLYFLVLLYPLVKFNIVPEQGKLAAYALIGLYMITVFI